MSKHPIQPLENDSRGVLRFKKNAIVEFLLDNGGHDMNSLAALPFSQEDREQFAQLIGYSLSGFSELGYSTESVIEAAVLVAKTGVTEDQARRLVLEERLERITQHLKLSAAEAFEIHPDDLVAKR